jgi:hypothetical protein
LTSNNRCYDRLLIADGGKYLQYKFAFAIPIIRRPTVDDYSTRVWNQQWGVLVRTSCTNYLARGATDKSYPVKLFTISDSVENAGIS